MLRSELWALLKFMITASEGLHILSDFDPEVDEDGCFDGFQVQCEVCSGLVWINIDGIVFSTFREECYD